MTYFNFPHIEEDDNLKNLRNDVKSFLKTTFNSNNIKPQADAWMYSANPEFSKKLGEKGWLGMSFPKKYGGREKTMLERGIPHIGNLIFFNHCFNPSRVYFFLKDPG